MIYQFCYPFISWYYGRLWYSILGMVAVFWHALPCNTIAHKNTLSVTLATTRTWPSFVLQCLGVCVTLLMLEQAKRCTPEISECAFILLLDCLPGSSIRLLSLTWAQTFPKNLGYSLYQWLFLRLMSSMFNLRLLCSPNCKFCEKGWQFS